MELELVRDKVRGLGDRLAELKVSALLVFGSTAKGVQTSESDLDFVVSFGEFATFDRYMDLRELLEEAFGKPIDLVTEKALRPALRSQILAESVRVY